MVGETVGEDDAQRRGQLFVDLAELAVVAVVDLGLHLVVADVGQVAAARLGWSGRAIHSLAIAAGAFEHYARATRGAVEQRWSPSRIQTALVPRTSLKNAEKWGAFSRACRSPVDKRTMPTCLPGHAGLEGGEIDFVEGALADGFVVTMALNPVAGGEVLEAGDQRLRLARRG